MEASLQEKFFNLQPDSLALFDGNQQPKGRRILDLLDYNNKDVAKVANVAVSSVRFDNKMPAEIRTRLVEWATALNRVDSFFQDEQKTILWFKSPNPLLGGITPRDMIRMGRFTKLIRFINSALDANAP